MKNTVYVTGMQLPASTPEEVSSPIRLTNGPSELIVQTVGLDTPDA